MYGKGKMFHQKQRAKRMDAVSVRYHPTYIARPSFGNNEIILVTAQRINGDRKLRQRIFSLCEGNQILRADASPGWKIEEKEGGFVHLTRQSCPVPEFSARAGSLLIGMPSGEARWAEVFIFQTFTPSVNVQRKWRKMSLEVRGCKRVSSDDIRRICSAPTLYTWGHCAPDVQEGTPVAPPACSSKVCLTVSSLLPSAVPCFMRWTGTGGAPWARASQGDQHGNVCWQGQ